MKKGILFLILLFIAVAVFSILLQTLKGKIRQDFTKGLPEVTSSPVITILPKVSKKVQRSIFIPYWSIGQKQLDTKGYDTLIYFGVSPTIEGLDRDEQGYKKLSRFQNVAGSKDALLVLRMTKSDMALAILKNNPSQKAVIEQTIRAAKDNGFSGIVLDLELSALPFDSLVNQVTEFTKNFSKETGQNNLSFGMTVYGDTFYRVRPFDIKALARNVSTFYVMAYDFHKAGGNPGPNFPFSGKDTYGYDYQTMIDNFLQNVPAEKLEIVYGMYGYDWKTGEGGKAIAGGEAKSLLQIREEIIQNCEKLQCNLLRDRLSSEMTVTYIDLEKKKHSVWFEDEESVKKKEEYVRKMGIFKFSYWAYSYF